MIALNDCGIAPSGESLDIIPMRYEDGSLALVAMMENGEKYANISVNLDDYGLHPRSNAVFVPSDMRGIISGVNGEFSDDIVHYGYNNQCTACEFIFNEDIERMANSNVYGNHDKA